MLQRAIGSVPKASTIVATARACSAADTARTGEKLIRLKT